jgi:hypothetical protein
MINALTVPMSQILDMLTLPSSRPRSPRMWQDCTGSEIRYDLYF